MEEIESMPTAEMSESAVDPALRGALDKTENTIAVSDELTETNEQDIIPSPKNRAEIEKEEEAKLRSKYPGVKGPGSSSFLQKRLSKGTKYFDSGDYNMAKAKTGPGAFKQPLPPGLATAAPFTGPAPCFTGPSGDVIPTPDCVPHKRLAMLQSKLATHS